MLQLACPQHQDGRPLSDQHSFRHYHIRNWPGPTTTPLLHHLLVCPLMGDKSFLLLFPGASYTCTLALEDIGLAFAPAYLRPKTSSHPALPEVTSPTMNYLLQRHTSGLSKINNETTPGTMYLDNKIHHHTKRCHSTCTTSYILKLLWLFASNHTKQ